MVETPVSAAVSFRSIWDGISVAEPDVQAVARWLSAWEVAVPLRPYAELALHHGDDEERTLTKALLLDLRQPVYDSRAVFLIECERTAQLLVAWEEERARCHCAGFCGLPFLRAVWRVKPLILALPAGWIIEDVV